MMISARIFTTALVCGFTAASPLLADDPPARRGLIGIAVKRPASSETLGVEVAGLDIGSPAYNSDLRPGDLITQLNGKPLAGVEQFLGELHRPRAGTRWVLGVQRGDQPLELTLTAAAEPLEQPGPNADVEYTWLPSFDGTMLRAVITAPKGATPPWPAIVILPGLGGLACDDPEVQQYKAVAHAFPRERFGVIRWDQRGSGDSYGTDYPAVDLETEIRDAAAVLRAVLEMPIIDRRRVYLLGFDMGGVVGAHVVARQNGAAGLITWGTFSRPLVEYLIDMARTQGGLAGMSAPEINRQVRLTIRFYERLLSGNQPLEIIRELPELQHFAGPGGSVQGKIASFWRQLDATNHGRLYGNGKVPVLALLGQFDFVATALDQRNIVALAKAGGRNDVRARTVDGLDHYMNAVESRDESFRKISTREYSFGRGAVEAALEWIEILEASRFGPKP